MTSYSHFILDIRLGNSEMQSSRDVAEALRKAADQVDEHADTLVGWHGMSRGILDANGNSVGVWRVIERRAPKKDAKAIVKAAFEIRDGDVQETSASFIRGVIADAIEGERGQVR